MQIRQAVEGPGRRRGVFAVVAAVAGLVLLFVHYWRLEAAPPGFYLDEATNAYDAFSVSVNGRERHGLRLPLFFPDYGEYRSPFAPYMTAIAIRLFGPTVAVVRAVPSTFTLLTAVVLGLLAWRVFKSRWMALGTFVVVGLTPWLVVSGRIAYEATALPLWLGMFLVAWHAADQRRSRSLAALAGVCLAVSLYTYPTARLFVPLLLLALGIAYLPVLRRSWQLLVAVGLPVVPAAGLSVLWELHHPGSMTGRFQSVSAFQPGLGATDIALHVINGYLYPLGPPFLFQTLDTGAWGMSGRTGALLVIVAPLLLAGVYAVWRLRREPFWRFVIIGALFGPIPAAITLSSTLLRTMELVPFLTLIGAAGTAEIIRVARSSNLGSGEARALAAIFLVAFAVETADFTVDYFQNYPLRVVGLHPTPATRFEIGFRQAVQAAQRARPGGAGPIAISDRIEAGREQWAWFALVPPRIYQQRGIEGTDVHVVRMDGQRFVPGGVLLGYPTETPVNVDVVDTVYLDQVPGFENDGHVALYFIWRSGG